MKKSILFTSLGFLIVLNVNNNMAQAQNQIEDPQVIRSARQITFVGPRAGEGYFDSTGNKMVFQSEREPGNPFYQIYLMDLQSGATERISPGKGKTTCSWVHPDGERVMFSSTHLDPDLNKKVAEEIANRKKAVKAKYSWSYDPQFDIFEFNRRTKKYKRLTKEFGYDAEGSYSPDGHWIAFASNRAGYTQKLSDEDAKIFAQDPSYLMDIYLMREDGTGVRRLTNMKGYNGGPFFSPDGKRITWRHFAPNGQTAEIWTMNTDGTDAKQITHLSAMSWAPYYHPSGDYLIFTTNLLGFGNFELFIVDKEGKHVPVRVSYIDDFDGLPVFSPDGHHLSWTHRNAAGDSQIWMSDWDDQKARLLLDLPARAPILGDLSPKAGAEGLHSIVQYLASPELKGRPTGSPEELEYLQTLGGLMQKMKLHPVGGKDFVRTYDFVAGVELGAKESLKIPGFRDLKVETDFAPLSFSKTGAFAEADVVFAGYGIVAPATAQGGEYDSYRGLDVKDKWVMVLRDLPEDVSNERRHQLNVYSRLQHKALMARERGAKGLLIVRGPRSSSSKQLMKLHFDGSAGTASIPVLSITDEVGEFLIKASGRDLSKWQEILDKGELQNAPLPKIRLQASVDLKAKHSQGHYLLGELQVPGAKSAILIGAHGDHLGRGEQGNSLAKNNEQNQIHFGADDNASGVAGVMSLAAEWARRGTQGLHHHLIFAVWSGEEIGLVGSTKFLESWTAEKQQRIFANVNMDMIGRLREQLIIQGAGSATEWRGIIEQIVPSGSLSMLVQDDPYLPTDSMAFYVHGIPTINFFTGSHADYHSPRDTADKINYGGMENILKVVSAVVQKTAAMSEQGLHFQKVASQKGSMEGRSFRLYLGTIPDYTQEGVKGVRITGTSKDSPAEKAGLQNGDVIVGLGGLVIDNLYDYVYCLQSIKANQVTPMKILRAGKPLELNITPVLKE